MPAEEGTTHLPMLAALKAACPGIQTWEISYPTVQGRFRGFQVVAIDQNRGVWQVEVWVARTWALKGTVTETHPIVSLQTQVDDLVGSVVARATTAMFDSREATQPRT